MLKLTVYLVSTLSLVATSSTHWILSAAYWLAQTGNDATPHSLDPWAALQWGPSTAALALLATGQLRFGREIKVIEEQYKLERESRIKAEADRDAVNSKAASEFIPLLTEATHLLSDFRPKNPDRAIATALSAIAEKLEEMEHK